MSSNYNTYGLCVWFVWYKNTGIKIKPETTDPPKIVQRFSQNFKCSEN